VIHDEVCEYIITERSGWRCNFEEKKHKGTLILCAGNRLDILENV